MENLTKMELETLTALRNECFISEAIFNYDKKYDGKWATGWSDCALDEVVSETELTAKQVRGVFSSLVKKGYISVSEDTLSVNVEKIEALRLKK